MNELFLQPKFIKKQFKHFTTMEKEENNKQEIIATDVKEQLQKEAQKENFTVPKTEKKPKWKRFFKWLFIFLAIVVVLVVAAALIYKAYIDKDDYDYDEYYYEYGEEPLDGALSYNNGKCDIINPTTKEVIVKDIDWCHYSSRSDEDPIVLFAQKGKRGFCNVVTNEIIVPPTTYTKAWIFSEGLAAVEKNGFIGFVNTNGDVAIDFKFSYRGNPLSEFVFHNGHCIVADSSNRIGVIDQSGYWVIKPLYDNIELAKDYAIVYKDGEFKKQVDFEGNTLQDGIIDYINNLYYEVNYTDVQTGEPAVGQAKINDYYEYHVGGYSGLIDSKGGIITPPIYTDITGITPTLFKAQLQDWTSMVIIDQKGNVLSKVAK